MTLSGILGRGGASARPAGLSKLLTSQDRTALTRRSNQAVIIVRRDTTSLHPRIDGGVGKPDVRREVGHAGPYVLDVSHDDELRILRSTGQYANRPVTYAKSVTMMGTQ